MGAERWDEQVGSVADEAARLLESLRRSAEQDPADRDGTPPSEGARPAADRAASSEDGTRPGCTDPFCQWCPLCRTSAVVRSLSPETLARLADLAGVAAAVLGDLASARSRAGDSGNGTGGPSSTTPDTARSRARRIPVRDADDPQEDPRA